MPFFTAEMMPAGMPMRNAIRIAIEPSWSVTGSFWAINSRTGILLRSDSPKLPVRTPLSQ
ncbi:hypothetical protein ACVWXN_005533 [Bradyrhizobium sp. i1.4.4]